MRIIGIVGIWSTETLYKPTWKHLEAAFRKRFPVSTFCVEYQWFSPWEGERMRNFAKRIVEKHDTDGEEIMLVGMSMGGVIAAAIAPMFKKAKVCKVVTIWSPHTFWGGVFSRMLGSDLKDVGAPVLSCAARYDWCVIWGAQHPAAKKHIVVATDHLCGVVFSSYPAEQIAEAAIF